eukprot:NODE_199_length_13192_cov_0.539219.p10 type:complete len:140 gc:universal NODE_199_length_13192_cov_0.539219:7473-7054(-)
MDVEYAGGRVLEAVIRPYATRIAGEPLNQYFVMNTLEYYLEFRNPLGDENSIVAFVTNLSHHMEKEDMKESSNLVTSQIPPTIIYVPLFQYEHHNMFISVSDGRYTYNDKLQTLMYNHECLLPGFKHWIRIRVNKGCCT